MSVEAIAPSSTGQLLDHVGKLRGALTHVERHLEAIEGIGARLAVALSAGQRLLVAGNGGSAAHAQHLSSELVGRFRGERAALSAICLHGDGSSVTAIANDYGADEIFARQVAAHGRPGDALLLLTTSGRSPNLLQACRVGRECGVRTIAVTGPRPNPLAHLADDVVAVEAPDTATIQEVHQLVVHLLCIALEAHLELDRTGERR